MAKIMDRMTGVSRKALITAAMTAVAMTAFAANSIFCRMALARDSIDPAAFTALRLISGAVVLCVLIVRRPAGRLEGGWSSAIALLAYAACFAFAYTKLAAGTGALLLFGAVQATMVLRGVLGGEQLDLSSVCGLVLAFAGMVWLVAPGVAAPDPGAAGLMIAAGIAWGVYSLLGRGSGDPVATSAGNFLRAALLAVPLLAVPGAHWTAEGAAWAVLSGGLASGLGYVAWYAALSGLTATKAASVQLCVPVLTALGGALLLGEAVTVRLAITSIAVLGGIALVVRNRAGMAAREAAD